jgi:predicted transcriptional regulator
MRISGNTILITGGEPTHARTSDIEVAQLCYNNLFTWSFAMSTTTIRLPQDLKERIARAAERAGTTAHSFILEAIAEKAEQEERRGEFQNAAERRYADIVASGKTVPWNEMRRYLERRLTGKKVARPKARTITR